MTYIQLIIFSFPSSNQSIHAVSKSGYSKLSCYLEVIWLW